VLTDPHGRTNVLQTEPDLSHGLNEDLDCHNYCLCLERGQRWCKVTFAEEPRHLMRA
jgi:hypothetical protein